MALNPFLQFFFKIVFYHATFSPTIKKGLIELVFELLRLKAKIRSVFNRLKCCYGNVLFQKKVS